MIATCNGAVLAIRILVLVIFSAILTIYARQMKIYNRGWEDDKFLKMGKLIFPDYIVC